MFNTNKTNHCVMRKAKEDMVMVKNQGACQIQTSSKLYQRKYR